MKTSNLTFMSYWFKNECRYVAFRLKTQTQNLIETHSVVSEMTNADKRDPLMQQTTGEIYISRGRCPLGNVLMQGRPITIAVRLQPHCY